MAKQERFVIGDRVMVAGGTNLRGTVIGLHEDGKQVRVKWDEMAGGHIRSFETWAFKDRIKKVE